MAKVAFDRFCNDDTLVEGWRRLEATASLPTQSYTFSNVLARTMLARDNIEVFLVPGSNGVGALLPLCRRTGYFARWRMLGAWELSEPGDALHESPETAQLLGETIAREKRPLLLSRIPSRSPLIPALKAAMKGKAWVVVRPGIPCPTITLDERWKTPESCFNSGRRSDFRRAARRAGEFGQVSYEILSPDPDRFDALFDEAIGVELSSWKKDAGTAIASDRGKENFFRDFFRSCCERGLFRLAFLRIDGQAVAMQMAVESRDRYWLFKIGYDEQFRKCSPGTLLMLHTLSDAATRGLGAYELLGNVEPWIAELWTQEQHDCVSLRTYPFNAKGGVALAADAAVHLREQLKRRSQ